MADIKARLAEASREELLQILVAVCAHATTRNHVESVINYLDAKKAKVDLKRRSSRISTRASSEASQDSNQASKTVKRTVKICKLCEKAYDEKENSSKSCCYHPGEWLIECEEDSYIWFEFEEKAHDRFKADANLMRILSCCNTEKGISEGCTFGKHVALAADVEAETTKDNAKNIAGEN